jgi:FlaG/FlaF family flagellin (archaellin)
MKKRNFSKKLNLNKSIVSNLSANHMIKINGGSENLNGDHTTNCTQNYNNSNTCNTHTEPQAASTAIISGGKI